MHPIRVARTSAQADEWALVLIASGIPHDVEHDERGWTVLVPGDDVNRAQAVLAAYDAERGDAPDVVPPPLPDTRPYPWMSGVTVGLLLLAGFALTGSSVSRSRWFERGAAVAGRVVGDEPWRAITALTLHVDAVHVLGNAVAAAILLPPLAERLGVGVALGLALLAGAIGNTLTALVHDAGHAAIGASTAIFGVIGALAALRVVRSGTSATPRRIWVVLTAAMLLLVLLGTARGADLVAHALGLVTGGALGLVAGALLQRPPRPMVQWIVAALTTLAVAGAWRLALR